MVLLRCYAKITDWIYEVFNHAPAADYRFLPVFSYGFWVAMGFFAAATLATLEMRRRERLGLLAGAPKEITEGEPPTIAETVIYALFGFIIAFKGIGFIVYRAQLASTLPLKNYLLSLDGSWIGGIIGGAGLAYYNYQARRKAQLPQPVKRTVLSYPSESMGDLVIIAAILGVLGSILFNFLESPGGYERFWEDPAGFLTSGLSIYGGLICAGLGFAVYAWKKKIHFGHFFDSIAPGFMLANGFGRLGCQMSGDGDWGLVNLKPRPDWVPQWLWSSHYEHNVINTGEIIPGCQQVEEHCSRLIDPVYPTPVYEFIMCAAIFLVLWALRKKLTKIPGMLFAVFAMLIGIQRYSIEQWRDISDRELYHVFGFALRQSEIISIVLFVIGLAGVVYLYSRHKKVQPA